MGNRRLILLLIMISVLQTGCWSYKEIDKLSIVAGAAIDKKENGNYVVTYEIIDLQESGDNTSTKSRILESEGDTIFDAVRNSLKLIAPRLYFGHMEILIISQEIARNGVLGIVDFFSRDAEPRLTIELLISKEKTAMEVLKSKSVTKEIYSFEINEMLRVQDRLSKSPKAQVYQFINELPCDGISPILPAIEVVETGGIKTAALSGTAVFKSDKLVGYLEEEDTKYLLFIKDKIRGGIIVMEDIPGEEGVNLSFEIFNNKTRVKPVYSDGKVSIKIETKTEVAFAEQGRSVKIFTKKEISNIEKALKELLEENMREVIQKVRKDYGVDIFGFGRIVHSEMPDLWKGIGDDWSDIFINMDIDINAMVKIRDFGLLSKPVKVGR